jgi:hypothetical protein
MDLKITGTVKQVLEEQSGEGRNGPWRKQEFILETDGNYPKEITSDSPPPSTSRVGSSTGAGIPISRRGRSSGTMPEPRPPARRRGTANPSPSRPTRTTKTTTFPSDDSERNAAFWRERLPVGGLPGYGGGLTTDLGVHRGHP